MSLLASLLSTVKLACAERVFFAPGEVGMAFDGDKSRPFGDPIARSMLAAAVSELLSQEEIRDLPSNRPRIVRYEQDGVEYVIELVRQPGGIGVGVRRAKMTLRREGTTDAAPRREERPAPEAIAPPEDSARRAIRPVRDRRTVRVELDEDGVPVDPTALDLNLVPAVEAAKVTRRTTKPFKQVAAPPAHAGDRVYETRIIPRAGKPTEDAHITGSPDGVHITFLVAPGGFAIVSERDGTVVVGAIDYSPIRGDLFLHPWMTLRIEQGAKESIVTFYRPRSSP